MKNLIYIPVYFTENTDDESVFDHPHLVSSNGTIIRTLRSFSKVNLTDDVLIVPVPLLPKAEINIKNILSKFPHLNAHCLTKNEYLKIIHKVKKKHVGKEFATQITLADYPEVRNFGLIYAILNNYENIIMIDDDEVVEDKDFFNKAIEGIGKKIYGKNLYFKTGYYINRTGTYELVQKDPKMRQSWLKGEFINKALKKAIHKKFRFNPSSVAFGGLMVINKQLFCNVPFDPYITRGEDIDYVINAKHFGYQFLMDTEFTIKHLPPKSTIKSWSKIRRDIYRFIYEREKLQHLKIDKREIEPYPGEFLRNDLINKIIKTNVNYAKCLLNENKLVDSIEFLKNATEILENAKTYAKKNAKKYLRFQKDWVKFVKQV